MLWAGIGCAVLVVLSLGVGIAGYFYMKSKAEADAGTAIAAAASALTSPTPPAGGAVAPSCLKATACCKALIAATVGANNNAALAEQACSSYNTLPEVSCAAAFPLIKKQAADRGATCN